MSLNISIYNNHNILVRIVKQHCKESLQLWQLNNIYNSKYEHKAMLWQVCVCVGFRREACQTIAQETGLKFTAWRYRDGRGGTTVLSSHRAKREVMLHLVFLTILSCGTISKVLNMIPVWQQTPATCCSRVFWDGWTSWWCITMCWLSQNLSWVQAELHTNKWAMWFESRSVGWLRFSTFLPLRLLKCSEWTWHVNGRLHTQCPSPGVRSWSLSKSVWTVTVFEHRSLCSMISALFYILQLTDGGKNLNWFK